MLCHPVVKKCVICMALLLFSMNYLQLPKLVQKLNWRGISSVPKMTLQIFIFITSILMWEIYYLLVHMSTEVWEGKPLTALLKSSLLYIIIGVNVAFQPF